MIRIIKKDGTREDYNVQKVVAAVTKSANRALVTFTDEDYRKICTFVDSRVLQMGKDEIAIAEMHNIVEAALEAVNPTVAKSYRDYRNYKQDFVHMLDEVYRKSQAIMYIGDKENSNADSALVSTKRSLIFNQLNKELYQKFFLTVEELQACRDGYIYVHDMSARRDTMNCCLFDVKHVLKSSATSCSARQASSTAASLCPRRTRSCRNTPRAAMTSTWRSTARWGSTRRDARKRRSKTWKTTSTRASRAGNTSSTPWRPAAATIRSSP